LQRTIIEPSSQLTPGILFGFWVNLGFDRVAVSEQQCVGVEEKLFLDADPHELFVGPQRLKV
jgi:hypothetical protein